MIEIDFGNRTYEIEPIILAGFRAAHYAAQETINKNHYIDAFQKWLNDGLDNPDELVRWTKDNMEFSKISTYLLYKGY